MKKILLLTGLLITLILPCISSEELSNTETNTAQDDETVIFDNYSPLFLYGVGLVESQVANITIWGFNRYISQADYGMISWDSMWTNLSNPWVWDQDEFIVNHLGHPYQGSLYYSAARTSGNGFWASASITALGSVTWELLMETETPSVNDLIVTTFGGIAVGEMFFRLSDAILHGEDGTIQEPGPLRWIGATALSPVTTINHALLPGRPPEQGDVHGFSYGAVGFSMADVRVLSEPNDYDFSPLYGASYNYNLYLEYNSPYIKRSHSRPYDWFDLKMTAGMDLNNELFLTMFSVGHLYGWTFYSDNLDVRNQLGLYMHYDFVFNRAINLGANAIGAGWLRTAPLGKNWTFDSRLFFSFVPMGASDLIFLKYNDIVETPPDYERRNYSLSIGANLKLGLSFTRKDRLFIDLGYTGYNLHIINSSVPENGSEGIELIGASSASIKYMFTDKWFAGFQTSLYHKESFYKILPDVEELMFKFEITSGFRF